MARASISYWAGGRHKPPDPKWPSGLLSLPPKSSGRVLRGQKRPVERQHRLNRLPEPHEQRSFRPIRQRHGSFAFAPYVEQRRADQPKPRCRTEEMAMPDRRWRSRGRLLRKAANHHPKDALFSRRELEDHLCKVGFVMRRRLPVLPFRMYCLERR